MPPAPALETLEISALGHRGEGIAHHEGRTIFVPGALPGERVVAAIERDRGRIRDVLGRSSDRIDPFCPHFGPCGGCQLQHVSAPVYQRWKRGLVVDALARAGVAAEVAPLVDAHGAGRRRVTLHAKDGDVGYMGWRSHRIADIDHCPILAPGLRDAVAIARAVHAALGPCDVAITESLVGPDVAVKGKGRLGPALAEAMTRLGVARLAINREPVLTLRTPLVAMGRAQVALPVGSFLQATEKAEAVLAGLVVEASGKARRVADLFCGIGPFALRLAERAIVHAADSDKAAISALAAAHRTTPGLKPLTAERRDLFAEPMSRFELADYDCVVFDPPRAGAQAQTRALAASTVPTILAVSCDPRSFARDAAILVAGGYRLDQVVPVDQFAHSAHVEIFAAFRK